MFLKNTDGVAFTKSKHKEGRNASALEFDWIIFQNISQVVADENGDLATIFEKIHKKLKNNEKKS